MTKWILQRNVCIVSPNGRSAVGCSGNAIWNSYCNAKSTTRFLTFMKFSFLHFGITICLPDGRSGSGCPESCIWTYYSNVSREVKKLQNGFCEKRLYSKPILLLRSGRCPRSRETYIYIYKTFGSRLETEVRRRYPPRTAAKPYIYTFRATSGFTPSGGAIWSYYTNVFCKNRKRVFGFSIWKAF